MEKKGGRTRKELRTITTGKAQHAAAASLRPARRWRGDECQLTKITDDLLPSPSLSLPRCAAGASSPLTTPGGRDFWYRFVCARVREINQIKVSIFPKCFSTLLLILFRQYWQILELSREFLIILVTVHRCFVLCGFWVEGKALLNNVNLYTVFGMHATRS